MERNDGNSGGFLTSLFKSKRRSIFNFSRSEQLVNQVYEGSEALNQAIEQHSKEEQMILVSASYAVAARYDPNLHFATAAAFIVPNIYAQVFRFKNLFKLPGAGGELERLTHGTKSVFREIFPALVSMSLAQKYNLSQFEILKALQPRIESSSEHLHTGLQHLAQGSNKKARLAILQNEQTHTLPPILYRPWTLDYPKYLFSSFFFFTQRLTFSATPDKPSEALTVVPLTVNGDHLNLGKTSQRLIFGGMVLKRTSELMKLETRYMYDELEKLVEQGRKVNPRLIEELERHLPPRSYEEYHHVVHRLKSAKSTAQLQELTEK